MSSGKNESEQYLVEREYLGKCSAQEALARIIRAKIESEYRKAQKKGGENEKAEAVQSRNISPSIA